MEKPKSYCEYVESLEENNIHIKYHNTKYGFPIDSDNELFCRLVLEINQAGLSWTTILNKEENFRKAFSNFDIQKVSQYGEIEILNLLDNQGIIRNKLKINAAIYNAKKIIELQKEFGSFKNWLNKNHPLDLKSWIKLFKKTFKFTGNEITKEFLISTGYLPGAHIETCKISKLVIESNPLWNNK